MPSGIISDIETVLNTHLIAQHKQKRSERVLTRRMLILRRYQDKMSDAMWQRRQSRVTIRANNRRATRLIINYLVTLDHRAFATLLFQHQWPVLSRVAEMSRAWFFLFSTFILVPRAIGISIFFVHLALRADGAKSARVPRKGPWVLCEWCNIRHSLKYIKMIVPLNHLGKQTSDSRLVGIAQPLARHRHHHRTRTSQCGGIPQPIRLVP